MNEYTKNEISEMTSLDPSQVNFLTTQGAVTAISGGGSRGQAWKYNDKNRVQFDIAKVLIDYGITIQKIKLIISKPNKRLMFQGFFTKSGSLKSNLPVD